MCGGVPFPDFWAGIEIVNAKIGIETARRK